MERLARLVMRHRLIVSLFWLVTFVLGGIAAGQLSDRLTLDFSLPGQPGDNAENQLIESYGVSSFDTYVVVVTVPDGQTVTGSIDAVNGVFEATAAAVPGVLVTDYATTGDDKYQGMRERRADGVLPHPGATADVLRAGHRGTAGAGPGPGGRPGRARGRADVVRAVVGRR